MLHIKCLFVAASMLYFLISNFSLAISNLFDMFLKIKKKEKMLGFSDFFLKNHRGPIVQYCIFKFCFGGVYIYY